MLQLSCIRVSWSDKCQSTLVKEQQKGVHNIKMCQSWFLFVKIQNKSIITDREHSEIWMNLLLMNEHIFNEWSCYVRITTLYDLR